VKRTCRKCPFSFLDFLSSLPKFLELERKRQEVRILRRKKPKSILTLGITFSEDSIAVVSIMDSYRRLSRREVKFLFSIDRRTSNRYERRFFVLAFRFLLLGAQQGYFLSRRQLASCAIASPIFSENLVLSCVSYGFEAPTLTSPLIRTWGEEYNHGF